jgi:hypothetical protein
MTAAEGDGAEMGRARARVLAMDLDFFADGSFTTAARSSPTQRRGTHTCRADEPSSYSSRSFTLKIATSKGIGNLPTLGCVNDGQRRAGAGA